MSEARIIDYFAWGDQFKMPPKINMMKAKSKDQFVFSGTQIFLAVESAIKDHMPGRAVDELDILDFGCGVGRVAMPFFYKYRRPNACVDIMPPCIEYLREVLPEANPSRISFTAPLAFADASFDVIYSISVWTHMSPEDGARWLLEMKRILRPNGLALISTSSFSRLAAHRMLAQTTENRIRSHEWTNVTDDQLRREGIIFKGEYLKGVGANYGLCVHDPIWVHRNWSKVMPVIETRVRGVSVELGL